MPIVAILGHHPAFYLGTMGLTAYESDDYSTIGSFLGEPLRLVPSETWGEDFMVPADAEILIEGVVPPHVRMIADPFGDITRQYQAQTLRPVMEVTAITRRSDAILQDVFAGHRDHITVGQIPKEGTLYNTLRKRFGDIITAVHMPYSGCGRLLCYVSINKSKEGQGKAVALAAIQESWTIQTVVVVDDVIDVFDEADVVWAALVNVDPSRDIDVIHNIPNVFTTSIGSSKVLIDATRPHDRTIPPMNRVPQDAMDRINLDDYLDGPVSEPPRRRPRGRVDGADVHGHVHVWALVPGRLRDPLRGRRARVPGVPPQDPRRGGGRSRRALGLTKSGARLASKLLTSPTELAAASHGRLRARPTTPRSDGSPASLSAEPQT